MKKTLLIILLLTTFILSACINNGIKKDNTNNENTGNNKQEEQNGLENNNNKDDNNEQTNKDQDKGTKNYSIQYSGDKNLPDTIKLIDGKGNTKLTYKINDFKNRAKNNWDNFNNTPKIGPKEIKPSEFSFFDKTARLGPDNKYIWFSTNVYAMASTTSFIGKINIDNKNKSIVKDTVRGDINGFNFSSNGDYLSFTQSSARAKGDYLTIINTNTMNATTKLSDDDLFEDNEKVKKGRFLPKFKDLYWVDSGDKLKFTTNHPKKEIKITWSISSNGKNLQKINTENKTNKYKTHKDEDIGFSISYYSGMEITTEKNTEGKLKRFMLEGPTQNNNTDLYDGISFAINSIDTKNLKQYINKQKENIKQVGEILEQPKEYSLGEYKGKKMKVDTLGKTDVIYLKSNGKIYKISYSVYDPTNQGYQEISNKMLNSFKILE